MARQGSGVQLRRDLQSRLRRVLVIYPNWNTLKEEGFAARLLLGASRAAYEFDCDLRHLHYDTVNDLRDVSRCIRAARCDGVVWANPPEEYELEDLVPADCPVVSTHRWYVRKNGKRAPRTVDDFSQGFTQLLQYWHKRGVQHVGMLCHRQFDLSYSEHEQLFLKLLSDYDMTCPQGACLRHLPFDAYARKVLLEDFASRLSQLDALFSFAPNFFEDLQLYCELPQRLALAHLDSGSYPGPSTASVLRSQLTEHCRAAFTVLSDQRRQQNGALVRIPLLLEHP